MAIRIVGVDLPQNKVSDAVVQRRFWIRPVWTVT